MALSAADEDVAVGRGLVSVRDVTAAHWGGCGLGTEAMELARKGDVDVAGIDSSLSMIEEARRRASSTGLRVSFSQADAADLPFPDDHFDACQAQTLLGHISDPVPAVAELVRVTDPADASSCSTSTRAALCWTTRTAQPQGQCCRR